jgi:hypothetical protein
MAKVEGIIVDPDSNRRGRLRQACLEVPQLAKVEMSSSFQHALKRLEIEGEIDFTAIFISARFGRATISDFISKAKTTNRGIDTAYVLVLETKDQDGQSLTGGLIEGADGFLLEPFSVESLIETAQLAIAIKKRRQDARERAIVSLLITDALKHLDLVAERMVRAHEGGPELKYFRGLKSTIAGLNQRMAAMYQDLLPKELLLAPAPLLTLQQEQTGAVSNKRRAYLRVIERMRAKGIDVSDSEQEEDDDSSRWEFIPQLGKASVILFKIDLYDKPTSDALTKLVTKQLVQQEIGIEINLSNTRVVSSYALLQLIACKQLLEEKKQKIEIRLAANFVKEVFDVMQLGRIFSLLG